MSSSLQSDLPRSASSRPDSVRRVRRLLRRCGRPAALAAALGAAACGGTTPGSQSGTPGEIVTPDSFSYPPGIQGAAGGFIVDDNASGLATNMSLQSVSWGRLVNVYATHPTTGKVTLYHRDYVIAETALGDGITTTLDADPASGEERLTIHAVAGSPEFEAILLALDNQLVEVSAKGLGANVLPPFPVVPRNSCLVLEFSDLVDHTTLNLATLQVEVGYPPVTPFEARLIADPNHGGTIQAGGTAEFRTTRVLIDFAVSELDSLSTSVGVNAIGLPAAQNTGKPNLALRLPTKVDFPSGQFQILANESGHGLATGGNGPVDFGSPTTDVVRALRTGGPEAVTGDVNNGFLADEVRPRVVTSQLVTIDAVGPLAGGEAGVDFEVDLTFASAACVQAPVQGDALEISGGFLQVSQDGMPPVGASVENVALKLLGGSAANLVANAAVVYSTVAAPANAACVLGFNVAPLTAPATGVSPSSTVTLRFSEPMDPASLDPFGGFRILRKSASNAAFAKLTDTVVGEVTPAPDLRAFTHAPRLPLDHASGSAETYFVNVSGATDLAGNALSDPIGELTLKLNAGAPTFREGGHVLTFDDVDETGDGLAEIRGQYVIDPTAGLLRPRPVSRFPGTVDRAQALPAFMTPNVFGVFDPIIPLGSKLMTVYRYCDMGFGGADESTINVDVESIDWAALPGQVVADFYENFEINLAHSARFPDEAFDPFLNPYLPASGLATSSFEENVLVDPVGAKKNVHQKGLGYLVDPQSTFLSSGSSIMAPHALNQGVAEEDFQFYTWRDTAVLAVGGLNGVGADPLIKSFVSTDITLVGADQEIPSIALPLLLEARCHPSNTAIGTNVLDVSFASPGGARVPNFRIFSSGGTDASGTKTIKNPDLEPVPTGGFNHNPNLGPIGGKSVGNDDQCYLGQVDLVVRVSRVYTHWFNTGDADSNYSDPVIIPPLDSMPSGTTVDLDFRAATGIVAPAATGGANTNAEVLDAYGDFPSNDTSTLFDNPASRNPGITFAGGNFSWRTEIDAIDGSQFFQIRLNFLNNAATDNFAELSAIGIAYAK